MPASIAMFTVQPPNDNKLLDILVTHGVSQIFIHETPFEIHASLVPLAVSIRHFSYLCVLLYLSAKEVLYLV